MPVLKKFFNLKYLEIQYLYENLFFFVENMKNVDPKNELKK